MSGPTFDAILVPVASEDDARRTARALREHFDLGETAATFAYVVEKAGGAPDKAGVEQREAVAERAFAAASAELDAGAETRIVYDTDVAEGIRRAAAEVGADAIVFVPRTGGGRLARLLTGDVALSLVTETDRPVVALPNAEVVDDTDGEEE
ncbi:universal stress protein [Halorussus sp. AFM4]|uniref:universal stress protein n=1 Tax=Halorussus sp. AFM4 TaxID=3421651 RepID=UPI003EB84BD2